MKHLCQWNINIMLGDGLAALTSACESWLALDEMMTEFPPTLCPSYYIRIYAEYKNVPNTGSFH